MSDTPLATAHRLLAEAVDALGAVAGPGADDTELIGVLTVAEGVGRKLDRVAVGALASLERRGAFLTRGYRSSVTALGDLLGCERLDAKRRLTAAEHVRPRLGLDGAPLPPRLPATAEAFEDGAASLRHVEVVARVLGSTAATRLSPQVWAEAEAQLAAWIPECTAAELMARGTQLVDALDADGAEPDDRPPALVNELYLTPNPSGGGKIAGRYDDAALFEAITTLVDAHAAPRTADDPRTPAQRQAEALADACAFALDHGTVRARGGRRPHVTVTVSLEELERRARSAVLDFGGRLTPEALRLLCCDAAVAPVVLGGSGQPLDVGRLTRTIPDGLRRAVAARDGGCARCGRPSNWCEVHHIRPWELLGETEIGNLVMLCRACHRLVHHAGWEVRLVEGIPEFRPPSWIDPARRPRRRTLPPARAA